MDEKIEVRTVSLYPADWAIVQAFARDRGYPSTSAALRRIIDEWGRMKAERRSTAVDDEVWENLPGAAG